MINGLQVVIHLPLFHVKSPGNVNAFNEFFAEIANFNIIDTEIADEFFFYFPEMDAISLNLMNAGFENNLMVSALGTLLYMMVGQVALAIIHIPLILMAKAFNKIDKVRNKVSLYLYWNGTIRFFMEGYMDFAFYALMNL